MKLRNKVWLLLLLCIGVLTVSVGTSFARYREEHHKDVFFEIRELEQVVVGKFQEEVFTPVDRLEWTVKDGVSCLEFTVANGVSLEDYVSQKQVIELHMLGSLGIWENGKTPELQMTYKYDNESEEVLYAYSAVTSIEKGTAWYKHYGAGWLYQFHEFTAEGKQKLILELPGGQFSYITFSIKINGESPKGINWLQPVISVVPTED